MFAVLLTACGPSKGTPPPAPVVSSTGEVEITGGERIAWTQPARTSIDGGFAVYVDDRTRVELAFTCTVAGEARQCEAPVPPLTAGRHTLELVAWTPSRAGPNESARAGAITVRVVRDTVRETAAEGASDCRVAAAPNRELMLGDSSGRIRTMDLASDRVRTLRDAADKETAGWLLSGVTAHQDAARSVWIYVAEMPPDQTQAPRVRIVRYRRAGDTLSDRVVLFEQALPKRPSRIRLWASRDRIYAALLTAPSDAVETDPAPQPFLIRLTSEGRVPAGSSSVFAATATRPVEVVWRENGDLPWVIEQTGAGRYSIAGGAGAQRSPSIATASPPIAAWLDTAGGESTLWIAVSLGDVLRFHESVVGWVLSPQGVDPGARRTARDAAPIGANELAFCGPDVWRRKLRN